MANILAEIGDELDLLLQMPGFGMEPKKKENNHPGCWGEERIGLVKQCVMFVSIETTKTIRECRLGK